MTSKQRSNLRSMANPIEPSVIIGKGGITENIINEMNDALEAHELIKVQVLQNSELNARELAEDVARAARGELVQVMGSRITIYRKSHKKGITHIQF